MVGYGGSSDYLKTCFEISLSGFFAVALTTTTDRELHPTPHFCCHLMSTFFHFLLLCHDVFIRRERMESDA